MKRERKKERKKGIEMLQKQPQNVPNVKYEQSTI